MRILIIDPNSDSTQELADLIHLTTFSIEHISTCHTGEEGAKAFQVQPHELVFFNMEKPAERLIPKIFSIFPPCLVITSNQKTHAINAFKAEALDFILSPLTKDKVECALEKTSRFRAAFLPESNSRKEPSEPLLPKRIAIPVSDGYKFIHPSSVVHCAADANFTWIYLENGEKLITCRLLRELEEKLSGEEFMKVHRSHLVNLSKVDAFKRRDGWELIMSNGQGVPVARERKDDVLQVLGIR